jgi:hypothetical protein
MEVYLFESKGKSIVIGRERNQEERTAARTDPLQQNTWPSGLRASSYLHLLLGTCSLDAGHTTSVTIVPAQAGNITGHFRIFIFEKIGEQDRLATAHICARSALRARCTWPRPLPNSKVNNLLKIRIFLAHRLKLSVDGHDPRVAHILLHGIELQRST